MLSSNCMFNYCMAVGEVDCNYIDCLDTEEEVQEEVLVERIAEVDQMVEEVCHRQEVEEADYIP